MSDMAKNLTQEFRVDLTSYNCYSDGQFFSDFPGHQSKEEYAFLGATVLQYKSELTFSQAKKNFHVALPQGKPLQ